MPNYDLYTFVMENEASFFQDETRMKNNENILEYKHHLSSNPLTSACYAEVSRAFHLGSYRYIWPFSEKSWDYKRRFDSAKHSQSCLYSQIKMLYVIHGSGLKHIRTESFPISEGDFFLVDNGTLHSTSLRDDAVILNIFFNAAIFDSFCQKIDPHNSQLLKLLIRNILEEDAKEYLFIPAASAPDAGKFIIKILKVLLNQRQEDYALIPAILKDLLFYLIQCEKGQATGDESFSLSAFNRYLSDNLSTVTLHSAAAHFHVSDSAFSKQIQKYTGEKFSDLLRKMRLEKAVEFLLQTDMGIESIAQYLNYSNRYSFERAFQACYGMLPREYRDLNRSPE